MCDLWFPVRCRLNVSLKCWNDEMQTGGETGVREREKPATRGSTGGGADEIKEWKREEQAESLLKRVVRRALLEVLSRLNGATEANLESITPVLLALLLLPSSVLFTLRNISPSPCLSPLSSLAPHLFVSIPHMGGNQQPVSQSD